MYFKKQDWSIVYDKAIRKDGSLLFPKRLTKEFLDEQRRAQGSYIFFNQYLNEIIPDHERENKREWIKYFDTLPARYHTFAFIDPAISQSATADYTALVVVHVSEANDWYLDIAKRYKITATETIELMFQVNEKFKPRCIGVEVVAYQKALMHFVDVEMRKRNKIMPVTGITRGPDKTKEMRIRALQPRFEWGRIFIRRGLVDFEDEYLKFPKASHDDLLDALASIEDIAHAIAPERKEQRVPAPNHKDYERYYINERIRQANLAQEAGDY